jgi:hypothetical protein
LWSAVELELEIMAIKLNAVIAVEKGIKARAHGVLTEQYKTVQKAELFSGLVRVYQKKDDAGEDLPSEKKHVQFRIQDVLATVRLSQSELYDVTAQKDLANTLARAAILIDGKPITPELPVTTLLFLEKQITDLRTFIGSLPVLDVSESWDLDGHSGLYKTEPVGTHRTKKVVRPLVLYPATPEHPAQTQIVQEDVIAGFWNTTRQSAAMPRPEKERIAERAEKLLIAIKEARERANDIEASKKPAIGSAVFEFLFTE